MSSVARPIVRVYRRSLAWRQRGFELVAAVFDGFWLGVMDEEALAELVESFYPTARAGLEREAESFADAEYNMIGFYDWEARAVDLAFAPGERVVVTGAGGGREVLALLEHGVDAVGYEPDAGFVGAGRRLLQERGAEDRLQVSPPSEFPKVDRPCAGVLVGWGSYSHIHGRERRVEFLADARAALNGGGSLVLSFLLRSDQRFFRVSCAVANLIRRLRRATPVELGDVLHPTFMHRFTRAEVESELDAAGFRLETFAAEPYGHAVARTR
jgi:SAM-dependent methyltransferase